MDNTKKLQRIRAQVSELVEMLESVNPQSNTEDALTDLGNALDNALFFVEKVIRIENKGEA